MAAQPAAPGERKAGGNHEGITVHGHWTIEVKNPDGKLVSHTEFENALVQPVGAVNLSSLLFGTIVPGGFWVRLTDGIGDGGPCPSITTAFGLETNCILIGSLVSPEPAGFGDSETSCGGSAAGVPNAIAATGPCFPLSISSAPGGTGLAFSGTAIASTTDSITDVYLASITCGETVSTSPPPGISGTSPSLCAQGVGAALALTHATLPTKVTISAAGQLISVNVQLSFQ